MPWAHALLPPEYFSLCFSRSILQSSPRLADREKGFVCFIYLFKEKLPLQLHLFLKQKLIPEEKLKVLREVSREIGPRKKYTVLWLRWVERLYRKEIDSSSGRERTMLSAVVAISSLWNSDVLFPPLFTGRWSRNTLLNYREVGD